MFILIFILNFLDILFCLRYLRIAFNAHRQHPEYNSFLHVTVVVTL